jgi:hypothetical protein
MAKKKSKKPLKNKPKAASKKARSYVMPAVKKKSRKATGKRKAKRTTATEHTATLVQQEPMDLTPITKLLAEQTGLLGLMIETLEVIAKGIAPLGERKGAKKAKVKAAPVDSDVDTDDDHGANDDEHEATADAVAR